jgi:nitrogen fixation/metabolism regulation signal transduction histidine kinase
MTTFFKMKTGLLTIKVKFTILAIGISLASFGVAAVLSTQWLAEAIQEDYKEKATLIWTHIIHDIEESMIRRIHPDISRTLDIYKSYKEVEEVRIFNRHGSEVFTQGPASLEPRVEEVIRNGHPIQFEKKMAQGYATTFIIPIQNKQVCHSCHERSDPLRGALLLSLRQESREKHIGQQKQRFFVLFGLIAIVTIIATLTAVKVFFLNPLKPIREGAEAIQKGDFKYQIPVRSTDEIGGLAKNFNNMAQTLWGYFKKLEDNHRQLTDQYNQLSRSQKEWQETFDCITDPIAVIDKDFNIAKANRAFYEYYSLPPFTPIRNKCYEIIGTCLQSDCPHSEALHLKKPLTNEIADPKTGKILQISIFPYDPEEEGFTDSIFIAKNITEKKENELRQIIHERLAALGEMASGIAHELNNPLATISACTESLIKRIDKETIDPPLFSSYLRMIEEEIERCKKITTGMLLFIRGTNSDKKKIDIHEVLNKTMEALRFQGRLREIEVLYRLQKELPMVMGNEGELMQVFTSIVVNALDAMEDKGILTLETGTHQNNVFIRIQDTGTGIPSFLINRIFDPFFTTKMEKGGTGLGLSIAAKIIKENHGKIDVTSEEGNGTVFTINLPI